MFGGGVRVRWVWVAHSDWRRKADSFAFGYGMEMQKGCGMEMQRGCGMEMQRGCGMEMRKGCGMEMQRGCGMEMRMGWRVFIPTHAR